MKIKSCRFKNPNSVGESEIKELLDEDVRWFNFKTEQICSKAAQILREKQKVDPEIKIFVVCPFQKVCWTESGISTLPVKVDREQSIDPQLDAYLAKFCDLTI